MTCSSNHCDACPVPAGLACVLCRRGRCELARQEAERKKVFSEADTYWTDFARQNAGIPRPEPEPPRALENVASAPTAGPEGPGYPPLWRMAVSFVKDATKHLLNGMPKASEEVYAHRRAVCAACEHLTPEGRCGHGGCGCGVELKASWAMTACPFGKWEK